MRETRKTMERKRDIGKEEEREKEGRREQDKDS